MFSAFSGPADRARHVSSYSRMHVSEHKALARLLCDGMSHRAFESSGPWFCFTHANKRLSSTVCRIAPPPTVLPNWNKIEETYINAKPQLGCFFNGLQWNSSETIVWRFHGGSANKFALFFETLANP